MLAHYKISISYLSSLPVKHHEHGNVQHDLSPFIDGNALLSSGPAVVAFAPSVRAPAGARQGQYDEDAGYPRKNTHPHPFFACKKLKWSLLEKP